MTIDPNTMRQAVVDGDAALARQLARDLAASDADLLEAIENGFAAGIREVGDLWEAGDFFLPELVQGAEAMRAAMEVLNPVIRTRWGATEPRGRVVIGTVQGDLHDIGKSLVATLLAANGFEVYDLGSDVPVSLFVDKAREVDAHLVAASALLTTTMPLQRELSRAVAQAGIGAKVLVAGSPTSPAWARSIGAEHAENALQAVKVAERMVNG